MKKIILFVKKIFNTSRNRYLVEYKIENKLFNLVVTGESEKDAVENFEYKWVKAVGNMYPFPSYQIISVRRFFNRIKIS